MLLSDRNIANISVARAIRVSAIIIKSLRLYLSAQAPPKRDINICGTVELIVSSEAQVPDEVFIATNHIRAICTIDDPNRETACPTLKRIVLKSQDLSAFSFSTIHLG